MNNLLKIINSIILSGFLFGCLSSRNIKKNDVDFYVIFSGGINKEYIICFSAEAIKFEQEYERLKRIEKIYTGKDKHLTKEEQSFAFYKIDNNPINGNSDKIISPKEIEATLEFETKKEIRKMLEREYKNSLKK